MTLIYTFEHWEIANLPRCTPPGGTRNPLVATTWLVPITSPLKRDFTRAAIVGYSLFGWLFTSIAFLHAIDNGVHSIDAVADPGS